MSCCGALRRRWCSPSAPLRSCAQRHWPKPPVYLGQNTKKASAHPRSTVAPKHPPGESRSRPQSRCPGCGSCGSTACCRSRTCKGERLRTRRRTTVSRGSSRGGVCGCVCVVQRVAAHVCEGRRGEAEARHHGRGPGASGCVWGAWPTQAPATPCPASLCAATPCPLVSPLAGVGPRGVLGVEDLEGEVGRRIRGSQARSGGCMFQQADRVTIQSRPAAAGQQAPCFDRPSGCGA